LKAQAITFPCCIKTYPNPNFEASLDITNHSVPDGMYRTGPDVNLSFYS